MKREVYNKLVRDKIPEIIDKSGKNCLIGVLNNQEYLAQLDKKLDEEISEFRQTPNVEELADIIEVIYAIASARGISSDEIESARLEKLRERGGFAKRIFLKEVSLSD